MPDRTTTLRLLRHSAHDLVREVGVLPAAGHLWRPAEGEWSVHECLSHLRDVEREVFLQRIRRAATEDRPSFEIFDEVKYHKEHWNADEPLDAILAGFVNARAEIVNVLAAADWSRIGVHASRGPISLGWQADYALGHTWEHMSQILRARLSYELSVRK
ncbi:MAG: DinB family protein [Chloroflexi bacterium]|nr:DinB family protein [Chloroflexota bacterium]